MWRVCRKTPMDRATLEPHPISAKIHHAVSIGLQEVGSVLDVGGTGRLRAFLPDGTSLVNANKTAGLDGCDLPYPDDSFEAVVSIATLEHVEDQRAFLEESRRVSSGAVLHWAPFGPLGEAVEQFKRRFSSYQHPCVVPTVDVVPDCFKVRPLLTVSEHLTLLSTICPEMNCLETYAFATKNRGYYGAIIEG